MMRVFSLLLMALMGCAGVQGQTLKIGLAGEVIAMDPHFYNATPQNTVALHVFSSLVDKSATGELRPGLAESWLLEDDLHWTFKLRDGVRFHDGTRFDARDVVYSLNRLANVPGAPGGFSSLVATVTDIEAVDTLTVRMTTSSPYPNLPMALSNIMIVPASNRAYLPEDYNSGKAMNGTGPYRFVSYSPGEGVQLRRNETWFGGRADWETVDLRIITNPAIRTSSILSGDLDMIEVPSATDLERLSLHPGLAIASQKSDRVAYINPIFEPAPDGEQIIDPSGNVIQPLANLKVRQALSYAINREGLSKRIMLETSLPTGQMLPEGMYSWVPEIGVPAYDPQKARALLQEAGYGDGFSLVLTAANDRVPYNVEVAQAVAQMWSRIGVRTQVNGIPTSVYARQAAAQKISVYIGSWGNPSLEVGRMAIALLHSYQPEKSLGTYNWSRYSNPRFDAVLTEAISTMDVAAREEKLREATRIALLEDQALIPLYHFVNYWAMRKDISYEARSDGLTLAQNIHPLR